MDLFACRSEEAAGLCEPDWTCRRVSVPAGCISPQLLGPVLAEGLLEGAAFRREGYEECPSPALLFEMGITGSSFSSGLCCWSTTIKLHPSPGQGGSAVSTPGQGTLQKIFFLGCCSCFHSLSTDVFLCSAFFHSARTHSGAFQLLFALLCVV